VNEQRREPNRERETHATSKDGTSRIASTEKAETRSTATCLECTDVEKTDRAASADMKRCDDPDVVTRRARRKTKTHTRVGGFVSSEHVGVRARSPQGEELVRRHEQQGVHGR
jgi:hypothetical protein